jgi:DNA-binding IscR family transcriptional regulator
MRQARDSIRDVLNTKTVQDLLDESRDGQVFAFDI